METPVVARRGIPHPTPADTVKRRRVEGFDISRTDVENAMNWVETQGSQGGGCFQCGGLHSIRSCSGRNVRSALTEKYGRNLQVKGCVNCLVVRVQHGWGKACPFTVLLPLIWSAKDTKGADIRLMGLDFPEEDSEFCAWLVELQTNSTGSLYYNVETFAVATWKVNSLEARDCSTPLPGRRAWLGQ